MAVDKQNDTHPGTTERTTASRHEPSQSLTAESTQPPADHAPVTQYRVSQSAGPWSYSVRSHCTVENDTVMNFIPIPTPTELKVDKVHIMLIKS